MRTLLAAALLSLPALSGITLHSDERGVVGTWSGPAACRHGDGDTIRMTIARNGDGTLRGSTDWARSSSDGRSGPEIAFTTLSVEGTRITATTVAEGKTARLVATVDGDTISGSWAVDGVDDKWTFAGKRRPRPAQAAR